MVLSYRHPNTITWRQLSPSVTYPAVDKLYFSMREIQNPTKSKSDAIHDLTGIFPAFDNASDPRVLLTNPFVTSFTVPPVFPSSTTGVVEVELNRSLASGPITFDFSSRRFQIPFTVVDFYSEYRDQFFANKNNKSHILDDFDGDGFNNLTEWILDSNGRNSADIPIPPVPIYVNDDVNPLDPTQVLDPYFGFTVEKKLGTDPKVHYILERSKNNGKTWTTFVSDADWRVTTFHYYVDGARHADIRVRSRYFTNAFPPVPVRPPGTLTDIYRVKITL